MTARTATDAFLPGPRLALPPGRPGPLSGLTFAVKDLIDLAGGVTGAGNPDWQAAMTPARNSAPVVAALQAAGAACIGKTITDELAFSLEGRNAHYGTPTNPASPDMLPGGSSSGSAAAVASGACDIALGTDTGGSVRVPGAFCRLFAMRPSHHALSLVGVTPFAPGFDTVGWFAPDAETLTRTGDVLLPPAPTTRISRIAVAPDTFALCAPTFATALLAHARRLANAPDLALFASDWAAYHESYARLQARDIRESLGPALTRIRPRFAPDIADRFDEALAGTRDTSSSRALRDKAAAHLRAILPAGHAALVPTAPVAGLPRDADGATLSAFYPRALALCAIAGFAGAPQVQFPTPAGGLSLVAAPGSDRALLDCVTRLTRKAE